MRTVTFYSYKGGTGRTLLLANIAIFAARMGRKVVAIDVDLEAPGLAYKLLDEPPTRCDGLVGWLRDRFASGEAPLSLGDSLIDVPVEDPFVDGGWLKLMPAGRNPSMNYFQDLTGLQLERRVADGEGVDAFLDLKDQIEADLAPDVLLLDARTGITSTNLVTTRVLADDIVALTLDSREQLEGTRSVLRSLTPLTSLETDEPLRLHVVLTRIAPRLIDIGSYAVTDDERTQIERVRTFLREPADPLRATLTVDHVHLLHGEPSLVRGDFLVLARTRMLDATAMHVDCIQVAQALLGDEINTIAARVIAESDDPGQQEQLARFFVRHEDIATTRAEALVTADVRPAGTEPDLAARVEQLEPLAARDPTLRRHLGRALLELAAGEAAVGRRRDAVAPTERAVELYEELANEGPAGVDNLALSLTTLGIRYSQIGRSNDAIAPTERAVELYETLATENPAVRDHHALSLTNLGIRYSQIGRSNDAIAPTERAVELYEKLAAHNPAVRGSLAMSLNNLGIRYSEIGRGSDAIGPIRRAVELYEELAAENPSDLDNLATSLNNLGIRYSQIGRSHDAIAATQRAVELYEQLAAHNPAVRGNLAMSLNNLGLRYSEIGRSNDAIAPIRRAIELYEELATEGPADVDNLALSLTTLGIRYSEIGRSNDAIAPTERAVELYETLATENPAVRDHHALSLTNLGIRYSQIGRSNDAIAPAERAVELYEKLAAHNPAVRGNLAMSLNNLGIRYSEIGRSSDAIAPIRRAIELYEELATEGPADVDNLALSLTSLGIRYSETGHHPEAIAPARRAVDLLSAMADDLPAVGRPRLATALRSLAAHLRASGDEDGARAAIEESERVTAALLDDA